MNKDHPALNHLVVSLIVLIASLGILFGFLAFTQDVFLNPQRYFAGGISPDTLEQMVILVAGILASLSVSIVLYLLATGRTRTELAVANNTRWLAISREQFRRLYDNAPVPYVTLNAKGEIGQPNLAALRFFGTTSEELTGKNLFSYRSGEDEKFAEQLFQNYKLKIPINREELQMVTDKGAKKWVLISIFETKTPTSKEHTGLASIFDVTEQKRLDQAKTEFVSLASHQLRTPLATIRWYTEMLLSGDVGDMTPKQKEYVENLFSVDKEMIGLVDALLNVSRIEMGTLPVEQKDTNVEELTESILLELGPQIAEKKIKIEKNYHSSLTNIQSDPKLLRIVIQNLISNAVKYTPDDGSITITLEESGREKKIIVSDTGFGIPKDAQERIFTKLFRADNVRKLSESQGTGLGLYLVKSIVETLGGTIRFVSEENKGSTFTITL